MTLIDAQTPADGELRPEPWDPLHSMSTPREYWTTGNIGEALPGVLTPLSWDVSGEPVEASMRAALWAMGATRRHERLPHVVQDQRLVRAFYGRSALRVDLLCMVGDRLPGTSAAAVCEQVLGFTPDVLIPHPTMRRYPVVAVRLPLAYLRVPSALAAASTDTEQWWASVIEGAPTMDLASARALFVDAQGRWRRNLALQATGLFCAIQPVYDALTRLVTSTGIGDITTLTSGYAAVPETAVVCDLWRASRGQIEFDEVIRRHGFGGPGAGELSARVWREDTVALRRLAADYAKADGDQDPVRREDRLRAARIELEQRILASLPPVRRVVARRLLKTAARLIPLRGTAKVAYMQAFDVLRASSRRIGELLAADGVLEKPEDVFYLTADEVLGSLPDDVRDLVRRRRERRAVYLRYEIPPHWQGAPEPIEVVDAEVDRSAVEITGFGVSPGVIEGRARVLSDPSNDDFEPGEILVSSTTDPGWASIMFVSAGLVADIGGMLSHTAVVARELGIPCVTNTITASKSIRSGDLIRVDGGAGTVTILVRGSQRDAAASSV